MSTLRCLSCRGEVNHDFIKCSICKRPVHISCDVSITRTTNRATYVCKECNAHNEQRFDAQNVLVHRTQTPSGGNPLNNMAPPNLQANAAGPFANTGGCVAATSTTTAAPVPPTPANASTSIFAGFETTPHHTSTPFNADNSTTSAHGAPQPSQLQSVEQMSSAINDLMKTIQGLQAQISIQDKTIADLRLAATPAINQTQSRPQADRNPKRPRRVLSANSTDDMDDSETDDNTIVETNATLVTDNTAVAQIDQMMRAMLAEHTKFMSAEFVKILANDRASQVAEKAEHAARLTNIENYIRGNNTVRASPQIFSPLLSRPRSATPRPAPSATLRTPANNAIIRNNTRSNKPRSASRPSRPRQQTPIRSGANRAPSRSRSRANSANKNKKRQSSVGWVEVQAKGKRRPKAPKQTVITPAAPQLPLATIIQQSKRSAEIVRNVPTGITDDPATLNEIACNKDIEQIGFNRVIRRSNRLMIFVAATEEKAIALDTIIANYYAGRATSTPANNTRHLVLVTRTMVDSNDNAQTIVDSFLASNTWLDPVTTSFERSWDTKTRTMTYRHIVLSLSAKDQQEALLRKLIRFRLFDHNVYEYNNLSQCKNCWRFGHYIHECQHKTSCRTCGGDHDKRTCVVKNPKCANCRRFNAMPTNANCRRDTHHRPTDRRCPDFIARVSGLKTYWSGL